MENLTPVELILVPVDGSEQAHRAVSRGIQMAQNFGASILLVHVRTKIPNFLGEPYYQHIFDHLTEQANALLAPYLEQLRQSTTPFETRVLEGDPAPAILAAATAEKCDMIVMGTRGLTDFAGMVLGSVSHRVLHNTPCMVLLVH